MVRLTRIYTRTGDKGTTRLVGGQSLAKDDIRIEAYGTVDELNATIGMVRAANLAEATLPESHRADLDQWLHEVQQRLFDVGSDLATYIQDRWEGQPLIEAPHIEALERHIDGMNESLPPLKSFVLPGGGVISANLHLARTVCRRAERRVITLRETEGEAEVGQFVIPYLNRLSDALFVASRWVAQQANESETLWEY